MAQTTSTSRDSTTLLADPRYELMPFDTFGDQIKHLPDGATVTITASPQLGIERTIEATEEAVEQGFEAVPHVSARYVRGDDHLAEIAEQLTELGVDDIFVPGGDREEPIGDYESAYDLLQGLERIDYDFEDVGITGYPEGHDFLSDETLAESMDNKAPYATYIATQLCFDPNAVLEWIEEIRARGVDLPVVVGIPGVMKYSRLLSISRKVGVGDSIRFLQKTNGIIGFLRQLIGSRGNYTPDALIDGLQPHADDPEYNIQSLHIYTFNQVPDTESWRKGRLN
ncbi:methylenetetrahydrofolate reductase (NADPH) [Halarchaeum rubridurum]|uniref:Methylenetetrahydrofolate reductase n=1 Tax=Halarchaeum rubridurum TaxID=489911 RepID=A0A830FL96_9EURY|nr:methylenetetrahydrofolate reductase [Halarchaeum rubridurum]MBP1954518.1 methylenetetrahydrofolate reductase (NADPH) [Halarchaeum rubridurum]GGM61780.1 methylenetetrahydrofolate reductase [Halarchaeum rubridurum]